MYTNIYYNTNETCIVIAEKNFFPCIQANIWQNVRLNAGKIICIYEVKPKTEFFCFLENVNLKQTWKLIKACCVEVYLEWQNQKCQENEDLFLLEVSPF